MTIDVLSEYLKIIARDMVNKMEKKQKKIKAIICILTALLIAGCFIVMAFMPKIFGTKTASAEIIENPPTEEINERITITYEDGLIASPTQTQIFFICPAGISAHVNIKNSSILPSDGVKLEAITIKLNYLFSNDGNCDLTIELVNYYSDNWAWYTIPQKKLYNEVTVNLNDFKNVHSNEYLNPGDFSFTYFRIYCNNSTSNNAWFQLLNMELEYTQYAPGDDAEENGYTYSSYLYDIIKNETIPAYQNGYNSGYQVGYDKGIISEWQSPIAIFIQPIDSFLSTNIFGEISIGDVLSVILFVMVGIIFIKMFAGG